MPANASVPPTVERSQRHRHEFARGSKKNGGIKPLGPSVISTAGRRRAQLECEPPLLRRPSDDMHSRSLEASNLYGDVG